LIAMGAIAILFCIYYEFPASNKRGIRISKISPRVSTGEKRSSGSEPLGVQKAMGKESPPEKDWGRDPFEYPPGVELRVAEEGESLKALEPSVKKVTAILITSSRKVASINHKVVAEGDLIDGERVLKIQPDRVILQKGGRNQVIMLDKSPIQWTKNEEEEHEE
jgi:hypothetical protein